MCMTMVPVGRRAKLHDMSCYSTVAALGHMSKEAKAICSTKTVSPTAGAQVLLQR